MKITLVFLCLVILPLVSAQLQVGFYDSTCPKAESIVQQVVEDHFSTDPSVPAALLRMFFHDCFVQGCDASILIDSTDTESAEKDAGPNQTVRGFKLIDEAKEALEEECPQTVSCADIITLATRDSVALGRGINFNVQTGRRDGLTSDSSLVNLPGPSVSVSQALQFFTNKGLTLNDMVTLLGAHTVGVGHCSLFEDRLSNFKGTGKPDPSMDPALVATLLNLCATQDSVFLDQNNSSSNIVDNSFYKQIQSNKGILEIDQNLALDGSSSPIVNTLSADENSFQTSFAKALVKLGSVEVLVGNAGEIRDNCRVFN